MSRYIGLQQGDPDMTFDRLPTGEAMPEVEPGFKLLDLRTTSYQQLMSLSAASAPNPFGELLPFNPGVLPSRLGYMTGVLKCRLPVICRALPRQADMNRTDSEVSWFYVYDMASLSCYLQTTCLIPVVYDFCIR